MHRNQDKFHPFSQLDVWIKKVLHQNQEPKWFDEVQAFSNRPVESLIISVWVRFLSLWLREITLYTQTKHRYISSRKSESRSSRTSPSFGSSRHTILSSLALEHRCISSSRWWTMRCGYDERVVDVSKTGFVSYICIDTQMPCNLCDCSLFLIEFVLGFFNPSDVRLRRECLWTSRRTCVSSVLPLSFCRALSRFTS